MFNILLLFSHATAHRGGAAFGAKKTISLQDLEGIPFVGIEGPLSEKLYSYFSKKKLVLYNQDDAAWYKINGHDLPSFLDIL